MNFEEFKKIIALYRPELLECESLFCHYPEGCIGGEAEDLKTIEKLYKDIYLQNLASFGEDKSRDYLISTLQGRKHTMKIVYFTNLSNTSGKAIYINDNIVLQRTLNYSKTYSHLGTNFLTPLVISYKVLSVILPFKLKKGACRNEEWDKCSSKITSSPRRDLYVHTSFVDFLTLFFLKPIDYNRHSIIENGLFFNRKFFISNPKLLPYGSEPVEINQEIIDGIVPKHERLLSIYRLEKDVPIFIIVKLLIELIKTRLEHKEKIKKKIENIVTILDILSLRYGTNKKRNQSDYTNISGVFYKKELATTQNEKKLIDFIKLHDPSLSPNELVRKIGLLRKNRNTISHEGRFNLNINEFPSIKEVDKIIEILSRFVLNEFL